MDARGAIVARVQFFEAIDREISDDFVDAGIWVFLRGGNPATPWNSIVEAIKPITEPLAMPAIIKRMPVNEGLE